MARFAGIDLPRRKRMDIALTAVYGIGRATAKEVLERAGVPLDRVSDELTDAETRKIREVLEANYALEGDLRRRIRTDIKRLMDLGCYRGLRHRRGLPVRGQRTKTNARTRKGPRRTVVKKRK